MAGEKKQVNIDLDKELWYQVKVKATQEEKTLVQWVEEALAAKLKNGIGEKNDRTER